MIQVSGFLTSAFNKNFTFLCMKNWTKKKKKTDIKERCEGMIRVTGLLTSGFDKTFTFFVCLKNMRKKKRGWKRLIFRNINFKRTLNKLRVKGRFNASIFGSFRL